MKPPTSPPLPSPLPGVRTRRMEINFPAALEKSADERWALLAETMNNFA